MTDFISMIEATVLELRETAIDTENFHNAGSRKKHMWDNFIGNTHMFWHI